MDKVSLYDTLTFTPVDSGLHFQTSGMDIPDDSRGNLVLRAAQLFSLRSNRELNLEIRLDKNIPIGAGLGGGSSDCASTLFALNQLFSCFSSDQLTEMASELGSDVPFFLYPGAAVCTGRGELIRPVSSRKHYYIIAVPTVSVSTARVYKSLKFPLTNPDFNGKNVFNSLEKDMSPYLFNNMEETVLSLFPEMNRFWRNLEGRVEQKIHMSGSGSAVFLYFSNRKEADTAGERLRAMNNCRIFVVQSV